MIRDDILITTEAFHNCISEGEPAVVERLIELGYSPLRAEILLIFVPLGLARSVIARLSATSPIRLPHYALVRDSNRNEWKVPLLAVPEFVVAREMGEETFSTGVISRERFQASCFSVELNLLNQMLNAGVEIGGAVISPTILLNLGDAPGFAAWYSETVSLSSHEVSPPHKRLERIRRSAAFILSCVSERLKRSVR